jgi:hypothetical protein
MIGAGKVAKRTSLAIFMAVMNIISVFVARCPEIGPTAVE